MKRQRGKKDKLIKEKKGKNKKRQKSKDLIEEFNIVISGQFRTLAMFYLCTFPLGENAFGLL